MQLWKLHFGWVATFGRLGIILVIVNWKTVQDLINQCNRYFGWPHTSLTIFHNYGLRMVELGLGGVWFICVVGEPLVQLWSFLREYAIISWYIRLFFFFWNTGIRLFYIDFKNTWKTIFSKFHKFVFINNILC